jgi:3-phosphoshikimate 1-carboxyvinyltransferase
MKVIIQPSSLKGFIQAPASKSSMQRALAASLLTKRMCALLNAGHSNDDKAAMSIISSLGANVENPGGEGAVIVSNSNKEPGDTINCGESGLSIRMFAPIVALNSHAITVNGEGSLLSRPMDFFDEVLPQLGVSITSNNGKLPLVIKGPLQPRDITIDGSLSSQFLTGLLMAYAAAKAENISINVIDLKSKPYIGLTLAVIKHFELANIENRDYKEFYFHPHPQPTKEAYNYSVEGDWSGGAFLLVAGAIAGPVKVKGLDFTSTQADRAIIEALMRANAGMAIEAKHIAMQPAPMNGFPFDATDCPDLFPPLVALAAYCNGTTRIKGVSRLTHKESNRALTLQEEFGKMGVRIDLDDDTMIIHGGNGVKGATVHSRHDHRIAMACAVAALKAEGETIIEEAQAVKKSYPDFYDDLRKIGANVSLNNKFKWHE